jgi:SAM-dependent methyltransferase
MQVEQARHATSVTSAYEFKRSAFSSHTLALKSLPEQGKGRWVLDLGCASGYISELLAVRGYRVVGIERIGGIASCSPERVVFVEADLDNGVPGLGQTFDFILCLDILEHLRDPMKLLCEIAPLMQPGGQLIASLPNSGNLYFRMNVLFGRFPKHDRGLFDRTHLHYYTWSGWLDLLSQAGFRVASVRSSSMPFGLALGETAPVRAMEALAYGFARIWKKLFAYQFVVIAEPRR